VPKLAAEPVRDPVADRLLTPQNCVVVFIDYQPSQFATITSAPVEEILLNAEAVARLTRLYDIPTVVTTVAVDMGVNQQTVPELMDLLGDVPEIDRTGVNAWEDAEVRAAIESTGRHKIVICGLWTEVCLAFPTIDLLAEGYDVFPVADAVGGISPVAHERAFDRMIAAGAQPVTAISLGCELMRNWARADADHLRQVMRWYFPNKQQLDNRR
jgi:nicotinamidase-related amidase